MGKHQPIHFVAVVEQPANFDYSQSPRLRFTTTHLSSTPNTRSHQRCLERVQVHVTECLKAYLPTQDSRFLIWLIDGGGNPVFFVTGLLDVRSGESTRDQAATQERSLLSQITCEQSLHLVPVRYKGNAEFRFYEGDDFCNEDIESFGEFTQAEDSIEHACAEIETFTVTDAEYDGECLSASADISGTVLTSIPWRMPKTSTDGRHQSGRSSDSICVVAPRSCGRASVRRHRLRNSPSMCCTA